MGRREFAFVTSCAFEPGMGRDGRQRCCIVDVHAAEGGVADDEDRASTLGEDACRLSKHGMEVGQVAIEDSCGSGALAR